ncbi:MAG TPA: hypothetical protein VMP12_12695, partial [Candidatus Sulfotelmatobacter sp.]|nr:hypothetical protein [Candidatus Sulfotelmatobacter sp.]
ASQSHSDSRGDASKYSQEPAIVEDLVAILSLVPANVGLEHWANEFSRNPLRLPKGSWLFRTRVAINQST